ncbi:hypothetical protein [Chryseobacterium sp. SIMBA_038]|uniref:hypothetical protein n=1 Tax=Chryseobacterium sp. SIMBA_038 TaxID=3085780 RepID=UPI00397B91ED
MTKKLKLAIVLLITVASMNMNAQKKAPAKAAKLDTETKTAKPSKQETMDWIAEKWKENLGQNRVVISYKNGIFVLRRNYVGAGYCDFTYDFNKITGMNNEYSDDFYIFGKQMTSIHCDNEAPGYVEYKEYLSISGPNYNDYGAPFIFTTQQALVERLKKAFTTLIEYNSAKKDSGEAF